MFFSQFVVPTSLNLISKLHDSLAIFLMFSSLWFSMLTRLEIRAALYTLDSFFTPSPPCNLPTKNILSVALGCNPSIDLMMQIIFLSNSSSCFSSILMLSKCYSILARAMLLNALSFRGIGREFSSIYLVSPCTLL